MICDNRAKVNRIWQIFAMQCWLLVTFLAGSPGAQALTISGQVLFEGAPARNVRIYASDGIKSVRTNRQGYYQLLVPSPGSYLVSPFPTRTYLPSPISRLVTIDSLDQVGVDFSLVRNFNTSTIFGRITEKGLPLEGVSVHAPKLESQLTDKNGIYIFSNAPVGRHVIYPARSGVTFRSALREIRVRPERNIGLSFRGVSQKSDETYITWFTGLWDTVVNITNTDCSTDRTALNGTAVILQTRDKVKIKLPKIGTYSAKINGSALDGTISSRRSFCSVKGSTTIVFGDIDHASTNGSFTISCLFTQPCTLSFAGTLLRQ